jgi:hypothetical protein
VQNSPERGVGDLNVIHRLVKAFDRAAVHLFVRPFPAMHTNYRRLAAVLLAVGRRPTPCFAPIRREALGVLRMESVAECMCDDFVSQDSFVPRMSKTMDTCGTPEGFEQCVGGHDRPPLNLN